MPAGFLLFFGIKLSSTILATSGWRRVTNGRSPGLDGRRQSPHRSTAQGRPRLPSCLFPIRLETHGHGVNRLAPSRQQTAFWIFQGLLPIRMRAQPTAQALQTSRQAYTLRAWPGWVARTKQFYSIAFC